MRAIVLAASLMVASTSVFAQQATTQRDGPMKPARVVAKNHKPVGTPHKASAFAPRPTRQRVFGDPIQPPIMHSAPAKKKPTPPK